MGKQILTLEEIKKEFKELYHWEKIDSDSCNCMSDWNEHMTEYEKINDKEWKRK